MGDLQAAARGWGLNDGDIVVVYDDWKSHAAVRAWWLLGYGGVADVRVLDGGAAGLDRLGRALSTGNGGCREHRSR